MDSDEDGRPDRMYYRIDTRDARAIRQPPEETAHSKISESKRDARRYATPWGSRKVRQPLAISVFIVRKKIGYLRFCVDYKKVNDVSRKDCFPLPRTDDTSDTTGQGLWQFKFMSFGLCNAPATFERSLETVLRGLTYESCLIYLDDVIVIGRTFQEHLLNLRKVSHQFREAGLNLNPEKCQLFQKEVRHLGHIISPEGITTDTEKLKAVRKWPTPKNKHKIKAFCAYANITNGLLTVPPTLRNL
jgi:hypothetical protein